MRFLFKLLVLLTFLVSNISFATIKVGVFDTGLDLNDTRFTNYLCPEGHKDFTGKGLGDADGHGTHVVGLIIKNAGQGDYCLIIVKFFHKNEADMDDYMNALNYLTELEPDIINMSEGGMELYPEEELIIKIHRNIKFIVAAGNENMNIDKKQNCFYPACFSYPNVYVVGNLKKDGVHRYKSSNYGNKVKYWEIGEDVYSTYIDNNPLSFDIYNVYKRLTGTSMSAAIFSGKMVKEMLYEQIH